MSSPYLLEVEVIDNLISYYKIDQPGAKFIFDESMVLFHRLYTITDFDELKTVNNQVLSAMILMILHYLDFKESTK